MVVTCGKDVDNENKYSKKLKVVNLKEEVVKKCFQDMIRELSDVTGEDTVDLQRQRAAEESLDTS